MPVVQNFEELRQVNKKNDFDYGLSMEFKSNEDYEIYNKHPDLVHFLKTYWNNYVDKFTEIDYEKL